MLLALFLLKLEVFFIRKPVKGQGAELVNEDIPRVEVLLIDDEGNNLGKMTRDKALQIAYDKDLDLVVVNANGNPLVAKIMDYPKYRFDQAKKQKEIRKNQQVIQVKEIRLSHNIDKHDFETKLRHADKFISAGNKVKITLRLNGRMIMHQDLAVEVVKKFIASLQDKINVDQEPKLEGRQLLAVISPLSSK